MIALDPAKLSAPRNNGIFEGDTAGYYYLVNEIDGQPSISHWSKRFDTFKDAESVAKSQKKRAEDRAKSPLRS